MVVGEAPGKNEDEQGKPFVGKAGRYLRMVLDEFDIDLDEHCLTTNALICRPPNNKIGNKDGKKIDYCRPNVMATIREFQPHVIITLGRHALNSVIGGGLWRGKFGTMEKWIGWKIPYHDYWICPTYHPSYLLRQQGNSQILERMFSGHLQAAFDLEGPPQGLTLASLQAQVRVILDHEEAAAAIVRLSANSDWLVPDYETNCLKPEYPEARIVSCALSNGAETISYPWHGDAIKATGEALKSKRARKISSNLQMEERWTRHTFGHGVRRWGWDVVLAAHVLDNRRDICSLKFQSFVNLGIETYNRNVSPYLDSSKGQHYNRIQEIDLNTLLVYGGMDTLLEYKLAMFQREQLGYDD